MMFVLVVLILVDTRYDGVRTNIKNVDPTSVMIPWPIGTKRSNNYTLRGDASAVSQITAKVPVVCKKTTYGQWKVDVRHRFDEVSRFDCPASNCGGQCVALVKCACGAPYTGLWSPGYNVAAYCQSGRGYIKPGTAIATFEWGKYNNRWTDHTAVFLRCLGNGHFQVMEQACEFSARLADYGPSSSYYHRFSAVLTDSWNLYPGHHCTWKSRSC